MCATASKGNKPIANTRIITSVTTLAIRSWDNICDLEGLYLSSRSNEIFGIKDEIEIALEALPKREKTAEELAQEEALAAGLFPEYEPAAIELQEECHNPDGSYTYDGLIVKLQENP